VELESGDPRLATEEPVNLCVFQGRYVLVQFKQPYVLILPYAQGDKPMPTIVSAPSATPSSGGSQQVPLQVPFVMGKVKVQVADHGDEVAIVQFMDQNNVKMEVMITDDMIFSATAVSQDTIITP
jgi:hypothetical protein